jgi:aminoglycoside 6'-N-acetyltransferase I
MGSVAPEVFDHPLDAGRIARFLEDPGRILIVAREGGTIIGQLTAFRHVHPDQRPDSIYVDEVAVSPGWQRRGIGRALVERLSTLAAEAGCDVAWIATTAENVAARALYRDYGKETGDVVIYEIETVQPR